MIPSLAPPDLERQMAEANLSLHDTDEIRSFAAYLRIEAVKKSEGDPAGLLTTLQTVIYPNLYGDSE